jgi:cobalt/nickel transport protein
MLSGITSAHFNFFIPDEWHMDSDEQNEIQIIWGHPYEGIYYDAPELNDVGVIKPDGSKTTLTKSEIEVIGEEGTAKANKVSFTPSDRGDYILYTDAKPIVVKEEEVIWEDHVKIIINYKTTGGWDRSTGQIIEILPFVRPYGLEEGFVFVGQAIYDGQPLADAPVEIEKYYPPGEAPDPLPDWDPMITREAITDPNGVFSFTLDEPGVWVMAVAYTIPAASENEFDKDIRGILQVFVEESFPREDSDVNSQITNELDDLDSRVATLEKDSGEDDDDGLTEYQNLIYIALILGLLGVLIGLGAMARKK